MAPGLHGFRAGGSPSAAARSHEYCRHLVVLRNGPIARRAPQLPVRALAHRARRAAVELDARLLALENALTSPDDCESLESLVIDLARVAMDEAEAATRRAIFDAQSDAQAQVERRVRKREPPSRRRVRRPRRCIGISIPPGRTRRRSSGKSKRRAAGSRPNARRARGSEGSAEDTRVARIRAHGHQVLAPRSGTGAGGARQGRGRRTRGGARAEETSRAAIRKAAEDADRRVAAAEEDADRRSRRRRRNSLLAAAEEPRRLAETEEAIGRRLAAAEEEADRRLTAAEEDAARRLTATEEAAETELRRARDEFAEQLARERATIAELTEAQAKLEPLLAAAINDADARSAEIESAVSRADALEQRWKDAEHAREQAESRASATARERDTLALELDAARQASQTDAAALAAAKQARQEAEGRAEAAVKEREAVARDLKAARKERQSDGSALAAAEKARDEAEARAEAVEQERDALAKELDAASQQSQSHPDDLLHVDGAACRTSGNGQRRAPASIERCSAPWRDPRGHAAACSHRRCRAYVAIPQLAVRSSLEGEFKRARTPLRGGGAGFLGPIFDPLCVDGDPGRADAVPALSRPADIAAERHERRASLLSLLESQRPAIADSEAYGKLRGQAVTLTGAPKGSADEFSLDGEPQAIKERYGLHRFGRAMLLARRLAQAGVPMTTIHFNEMTVCDGWDTHSKNFAALESELLPMLDQGLSALIEDLGSRGILGRDADRRHGRVRPHAQDQRPSRARSLGIVPVGAAGRRRHPRRCRLGRVRQDRGVPV